MSPVSPNKAALLVEERRLLNELQATLAQLPAMPGDVDRMRQAFADLDELFLLVVAGEFNAGKSAFINALVGENLLPEGVTPTTTAVNLLRYAELPSERWLSDSVVEREFPSPWLRHLTLVDTPGTNAVIRRHEEITEHFVPRSDLVLFVTSADRPFTESERTFLERIRQWGKKVIVVLNKVDLLAGEEELAQVLAFITDNSQRLLGFSPQIFPVSARLAQNAKRLPEGPARDEMWRDSRFGALEAYIQEVLDDDERTRLKLLSPLGVAERLLHEYRDRSVKELALLHEDSAAIDTLDRQIALWLDDIRGDFRHHLAEIELIVRRMSDRGERFFDETLRLGRAFDLFNADKIQAEFERDVVADTPREVEDAVRELSDWLVSREQSLWRSVSEYLERRRNVRSGDQMLGELGHSFTSERSELLSSLTRSARQTMSSYDRDYEAKEMALSVRTAMTQTAVAEAGAIGLGALVAALASTAAVDVTGILAASVIAGLGFFILPAKRRRAKEEFRQKIDDLRRGLSDAVNEEFRRALNSTNERLHEALRPYTRFVHAERERRESGKRQLDHLVTEFSALRQRIG